jgi:hypothetical protein
MWKHIFFKSGRRRNFSEGAKFVMEIQLSKHLLFLGAGASYGSEADTSIVPPLAKELFDELKKFEPNLWGKIPDKIADTFRADFEKGMLSLAAEMPHALTVTQRSMAAFFYRYAPTPKGLYGRLADRIKRHNWTGAIATLNYERMLLLAMNGRGIATYCGGPNVETKVEICLPHGCCNLFCESVAGGAAAVSMAGMNVTTNGPVVAVGHPDAFWHRIQNDAFPPVMSYFEPTKFTTSGANFIEEQRRRLTTFITEANAIAIIGIQVREDDAHIWDALAATNADIYYCSGKRGATAYNDWSARKRGAKNNLDTVATGYWDDNFDAIAAHISLK